MHASTYLAKIEAGEADRAACRDQDDLGRDASCFDRPSRARAARPLLDGDFQCNCWNLYNRYKKHLPAERRREVDALCNLVVIGSEPDEVEHAVEAILGSNRIWHQSPK